MGRFEDGGPEGPEGVVSGTWDCRGSAVIARLEAVLARCCESACEVERKGMLREIADLLPHPQLPCELRAAALERMGRLARRASEDPACQSGLCEMQRRVAGKDT